MALLVHEDARSSLIVRFVVEVWRVVFRYFPFQEHLLLEAVDEAGTRLDLQLHKMVLLLLDLFLLARALIIIILRRCVRQVLHVFLLRFSALLQLLQLPFELMVVLLVDFLRAAAGK